MYEYPESRAFRPADVPPCDVAEVLRSSGAEVLVNYMPVGSEQAVHHYASACLEAGVAMVNCMPVFLASDPVWAARFRDRRVPIVGDDIKSQVGATIVHRTLARLLGDRGVTLDRTYQLNTGGNTDFLNMLERHRLHSKRISKTESVQSQLDVPLEADQVHIGPSDYVPWQNDNKVCFLRLEWRGFGDVPMNLELRMSVEDSPNSAGIVIEGIRCARLALDRGIGGPLREASAVCMKRPPEQMRDSVAMASLERWILAAPARAEPVLEPELPRAAVADLRVGRNGQNNGHSKNGHGKSNGKKPGAGIRSENGEQVQPEAAPRVRNRSGK